MFKSYIFFLSHFSILFFLNIYIANHYLAKIFGEYQLYTTLFLFLISFSQMGTRQSFTVLAPKVTNNIKLLYATLILRFVASVVLSFILLAIFYLLDLSNIAYMTLFLFIPLTMNFSNILDYYNKTIVDVKYNFIFDSFLFAILSLIVIEYNLSILYIILVKFISKSFAEWMKYKYIKNNLGKYIFSKRYLVWMYIKSKVFIANRVIVELYAKSEILILGLMATKKEVGLYVAAYSIYSALLVGEGLLARRLFPKLTKAFYDNNEVKKVLIMSIIYKSLYFITAIIITYYLLNDIIFTYLYSAEEFNKASVILDFMLIGLASHIFANNTNYLLMLKNNYAYMKRFSIGLLLNIILGCIFYYLYNLEGYTIAIQIVKIIMITYSIWISFSYIQRRIVGLNND